MAVRRSSDREDEFTRASKTNVRRGSQCEMTDRVAAGAVAGRVNWIVEFKQ